MSSGFGSAKLIADVMPSVLLFPVDADDDPVVVVDVDDPPPPPPEDPLLELHIVVVVDGGGVVVDVAAAATNPRSDSDKIGRPVIKRCLRVSPFERPVRRLTSDSASVVVAA